MNISLTPEQEEMVNAQIESGLFYAPTQVIDAALRLLQDQAVLHEHRLDDLRKKIAVGLEQIARGEVHTYKSGAEFMRDIKAESRKRPAERKRK
jgi:antitoxin ParD1/3/4